jgi:hypothetical protein
MAKTGVRRQWQPVQEFGRLAHLGICRHWHRYPNCSTEVKIDGLVSCDLVYSLSKAGPSQHLSETRTGIIGRGNALEAKGVGCFA